MGYRSMYEDRDKLFASNPQGKPVNQREVRKRLEGLFSTPKKPEIDRCREGHNWVTHRDGPGRCSKCKIPKPPGQ
ncbi:hypothetical protein ACFL5V_05170 [Fibrobacterota bacterium]